MAYINREKLRKAFKKSKMQEKNMALFLVEMQPTADVAEVKHGYNKTDMHPVDEFWCSECGFCCADYTETKYDEDGDYTYSCECEFDFCPRCGAKMDKENA